eukprot:SAG31_NODE_586_length_13839_cov_22.698544_13_plen_327_part_00
MSSSSFDRSSASSFQRSPAGWYKHEMWTSKAPWPRADSHIHLVRPGDRGWADARAEAGTQYNEPVQYNTFCEEYGVEAVLVVSVGTENDRYVADAGKQYSWCRGLAAFEPASLTVAALEALSDVFLAGSPGKIAGIALSSAGGGEALAAVDAAVWEWIDRRCWLISQNNSGPGWLNWLPILKAHPTLRLLIAHCGLPEQSPPSEREIPAPPEVYAERLAEVLALAQFAGPRVKLSGFYALAAPTHDFPHRGAWGLVEALLTSFGVERCCWGSDFTPVLSHLTFPQTFDLFSRMPFLTDADRKQIEGGNLLKLLGDVVVVDGVAPKL